MLYKCQFPSVLLTYEGNLILNNLSGKLNSFKFLLKFMVTFALQWQS